MSNRDIIPAPKDNRARNIAIGAAGVLGICAAYYFGFNNGQIAEAKALARVLLITEKDIDDQPEQ